MLDVLLKKWDEILLLMKEENDITDIAFKTWVQYFKPYSVRDHMITVCIEKDNLVLDVNYFGKKISYASDYDHNRSDGRRI